MRVHSQWVLLNREAAECLSENDFTQHFEGILEPDEHYFGSALALKGYPLDERVNPSAPTWVSWAGHCDHDSPVSHLHTSEEMVRELADFPGFFARKFEPQSDIGHWGLHLP
jgi:Core-2/I-Branching enzyme